jgi:hypothetical protein
MKRVSYLLMAAPFLKFNAAAPVLHVGLAFASAYAFV